jgi:uncharacterized protein YbcV (DUF1398 family)
MKQPDGTEQPNGMIKIAVTFKPELFKKLRDRARQRDETFSEVINDVAACGLFDYEEAGE